jgi:hypothetical protein
MNIRLTFPGLRDKVSKKSSGGSLVKHKFNAKPTECDGIKFPSLLEKRYYERLKLRQRLGEILFFLRQTPFHLPGNTKYVVDFVEFHAPRGDSQGEVVFTDVKGFMTDMAALKIKQVEAIYGITINIVKK